MGGFSSKFNSLLALEVFLEHFRLQAGSNTAPMDNSDLILNRERQNISVASLFSSYSKEMVFCPRHRPSDSSSNWARGRYHRILLHSRTLWDVAEGAVRTLADILEKADAETAGHQYRVAALATSIAREMSLPSDLVVNTFLAASLHDIGKIYIPEIIKKRGPLSPTELSLIKNHPRDGFDIVKYIPLPRSIPMAICQHHERLDGSGYPNGFLSWEIIMEARIVAVADVVEAMTSNRPYRFALGIDAVLQELEEHLGTFYDPGVVEAFRRCLQKKKWLPTTDWLGRNST